MKKILAIFLLLAFIVACESKSSSPPPELKPSTPAKITPKITVEREKKEVEPLSPEVKIKLRRDGKDNYSWELSGSDADEILKINEKLRKRLGGEQKTPP